jgi:hypothetical protein
MSSCDKQLEYKVCREHVRCNMGEISDYKRNLEAHVEL